MDDARGMPLAIGDTVAYGAKAKMEGWGHLRYGTIVGVHRDNWGGEKWSVQPSVHFIGAIPATLRRYGKSLLKVDG